MPAGPALAYANHRRFQRGEVISTGPVRSRMQLWCRAGRGAVTVDGIALGLEPGSLLLLPWRHRITYRAARDDPFVLGGVHVWPVCDCADARMPDYPAHRDDHPWSQVAWLGDAPVAGVSAIVERRLTSEHPALLLGEYAVRRWQRAVPPPTVRRTLAVAVCAEWESLATDAGDGELPEGLLRLQAWVRDSLAQPPDVATCARVLGCSPATATRLARRHFGCSLIAWVRRQQHEAAREWLRTTSWPIQEVARRSGYADPLHFSRNFHRETGLSPRAFRQRFGLL